MIKGNKKIENYLENTRVTLDSLLVDDFIKSLIRKYGYTEERLVAIFEFYVVVAGIYQRQLTARGVQLKISVEMNREFFLASETFSFYTGLLRRGLKHKPELQKELGLDNHKKRRLPGFLNQSVNLYENLLAKPHILESVKGIELNVELIREALEQINRIKTLHTEHSRAGGKCRELRQLRDAELGTLKRFMGELKLVLFRQFKSGNRQILERINIKVKNNPRFGNGISRD